MKYKCDCGHEFEYQESDVMSHRVMAGDSTKIEDVERLMDGKKADMVFTDPPYGMGFDPNMSDSLQNTKGKWKSKINNYRDVIGDDNPFNYKQFDWIECREQFWWGGDYYMNTLPDKGSWFVWDKRAGIEDIKWSTSEFELCWSKQHHHREILRYRWFGVLGMEKEADGKSGRVHPTQKPLELCGYFIKKFSEENNIVLDLFGGSGSTLIACEQTNRICYGMELDEKYVDVIRRRYAKFIGKEEEWIAETPKI
jgi:DNA modification methylase